MSHRVLFRCVVPKGTGWTSACRHEVDGQLAAVPASLQIEQFDGTSEFYLIRYDADHQEITDTLHGSVHQAMEQAEFELGITSARWEET
ncbi:MAG: hypothetical protein AAGI17_04420 [Planctomycetota bacterium]